MLHEQNFFSTLRKMTKTDQVHLQIHDLETWVEEVGIGEAIAVRSQHVTLINALRKVINEHLNRPKESPAMFKQAMDIVRAPLTGALPPDTNDELRWRILFLQYGGTIDPGYGKEMADKLMKLIKEGRDNGIAGWVGF